MDRQFIYSGCKKVVNIRIVITRVVNVTVSGILLMLAVSACSLYPDKNKDPAKNNLATFQQEAIDCAKAYPETGSGVHVRQRIKCMNLKGWY